MLATPLTGSSVDKVHCPPSELSTSPTRGWPGTSSRKSFAQTSEKALLSDTRTSLTWLAHNPPAHLRSLLANYHSASSPLSNVKADFEP